MLIGKEHLDGEPVDQALVFCHLFPPIIGRWFMQRGGHRCELPGESLSGTPLIRPVESCQDARQAWVCWGSGPSICPTRTRPARLHARHRSPCGSTYSAHKWVQPGGASACHQDTHVGGARRFGRARILRPGVSRHIARTTGSAVCVVPLVSPIKNGPCQPLCLQANIYYKRAEWFPEWLFSSV